MTTSLVTCDLETYYSQTYSLTKVTTEEYIRSPQYETIGISLKLNDNPTAWVPGPKVEQVLRKNKWSDKLVICQNTAFDGAILKWHYGVDPLLWIDIMGMSRALFPHEKSHSLKSQAERMGVGVKGDEVLNAVNKRYKDFSPSELSRYGQYCCNDTDLTKLLFDKYMAMGFPKIELRLLDLTLRMFIDPVLMLDEPKLRIHLTEVQDRKQALMETVRDTMLAEADPDYVHAIFTEGMAGIKKLLMSNDKFAALLRKFDVEPPTKISPITGKTAYAFAKTDEAFKELGEHDDERIQVLVAARLGNKSTLEETRTQRFIEMAHRGVFPVPLRYYGAHSGRWSGQDSVNLQNLTSNPKNPNAGKLKKAIVAPPGYVVIDCDSSQIEARTLAWLAGQQDLLDAFEAKQDVYKIMATRIYNKPIADITGIERQVGKVVILGAGYGVGHVKLKVFLKTIAGVEVTEAEAKRIIDAYRAAYPRIPELWRKADDSLRALAMGNGMQVDAVGVVHAIPDKGLSLPNGLHIQYPDLIQRNNEGKREWVYFSKGQEVKVYGGKCLAADTPVLTPRGWVPLVGIHATDKVWDGIEWVNHQGLAYQGEKATILLNGVRMTPDHQVLTSKGWRDASSCQGLHRADVRMPDGSAVRGGEWATFSVGVSMCMRNPRDSWGSRYTKVCAAGRELFMRMSNRQEEPVSRIIQTPRILGLEVYARSVSVAIASGMGQLRRARDTSMSAMGAVFRDVLGRHGRNLYAGANAGPRGQFGKLHPRELPVGNVQGASREPSRVLTSRYAESAGNHQYSKIDASLSVAPEPVYDLLNAGPRTRFMVLGDAGPFVVHNCVENFCQAVARCIIAEQMLRISKRYKVVLTVHDAIAIVAKVEEADTARAFVEENMRWRPSWAQDLPLACESGMGASYGDC